MLNIKHSNLSIKKARAALSNPEGRFESVDHIIEDDGWYHESTSKQAHRMVFVDKAKTIINYNQSPDIPLDRSINPYRGCEHGCIYCFARPSHSYLNLSPGLDFETSIYYKQDAVAKLREELSNPRYRCKTIALGINTDAYQPLEKELEITRQILELLLEFRHPVSLITKSTLILRDIDILQALAERHLVNVAVSMTSLSAKLKSALEPRAASPIKRLEVIQQLSAAGIPVSVIVAPVIPVLTDNEMENILSRAYQAGARDAGYVVLRLPYEVKNLFREWLMVHYPDSAQHVMNIVKDMHAGKDYDSRWGVRMSGSGEYAQLLAKRFKHAYNKIGFAQHEHVPLDCSQFVAQQDPGGQLRLGF